MADETVLGLSDDQRHGLLFLLGLALVLGGSAFAGRLGGFDVVVRVVGWALALYAPVAFVSGRFSR